MSNNNFVDIWDKLSVSERESAKYLLLLFPCYFSVQYLFNADFKTLSVFLQCVFTAATTIIMYGLFLLAGLGVSVASNVYINMEFRAFRANIASIALLIVLGYFIAYSVVLLKWFCVGLIVLYLVKVIAEISQRKPRAGK